MTPPRTHHDTGSALAVHCFQLLSPLRSLRGPADVLCGNMGQPIIREKTSDLKPIWLSHSLTVY